MWLYGTKRKLYRWEHTQFQKKNAWDTLITCTCIIGDILVVATILATISTDYILDCSCWCLLVVPQPAFVNLAPLSGYQRLHVPPFHWTGCCLPIKWTRLKETFRPYFHKAEPWLLGGRHLCLERASIGNAQLRMLRRDLSDAFYSSFETALLAALVSETPLNNSLKRCYINLFNYKWIQLINNSVSSHLIDYSVLYKTHESAPTYSGNILLGFIN